MKQILVGLAPDLILGKSLKLNLIYNKFILTP
jgi:hypothetical protein